ncbi:hypothetical protein U9R90_26030 [Streptomyces sp. E11-3]|uniref:LppX_LprAFG lipoprotein n=1 Tax=Streptomyces sp. E11-3 TaxID=3110112 RepID=UPI00397F77E1
MRRAVPLLATAATLLGAGCTGPSDGAAPKPTPSDDHGPVVKAAVAATRATTAKINEKIELTDTAKATTHTLTITGNFDLAADKGRLAVDLPGGAISHLDEIFADGKVYVRGFDRLPDTWASIARDKAEAHYLLRAPLNDPEHVLQQVAAMTRISKHSTQQVNGTPATRYRGKLDHATLTSRLAEPTRTKAADQREALGTDIPAFADAWIDPKGRVVRTRLTFHGGGASVTATMTLSDLGKPVKVAAPPSPEVVPVTSTTGVLPG